MPKIERSRQSRQPAGSETPQQLINQARTILDSDAEQRRIKSSTIFRKAAIVALINFAWAYEIPLNTGYDEKSEFVSVVAEGLENEDEFIGYWDAVWR